MNTVVRSHVHALIDQLPLVQLAALETILQSMLDPFSRQLASSPVDDEPFTEEDRQAVAESDECRKHKKPIPFADVLADFGLTVADRETMANPGTPEDKSTRDA